MKARKHSVGWHKLDNSANIFPLISHKTFSNVFRIAAQLNEDVDPERLQVALDHTLPEFGNFNFTIRKGIFWYYFEPSNAYLQIQEEALRPCSHIEKRSRQQHLIRVVYYKKKIGVELFHAISDGTGAINFLKALILNYLKLSAGETLPEPQPRIKVNTELEDSYRKHYKKGEGEVEKVKKAYRIKGKTLPVTTIGVIHGYVHLPKLIQHVKSKGVTLTEYLTAVYAWSIHSEALTKKHYKKPVHVSVPVNLRRFFESTTNMNFFGHITIEVPKQTDDLTFDDLLTEVRRQFKDQITQEKMLRYISKNVALRNNPIIRGLPLFIKNIFVRLIYMDSIKSNTSTLTNIGKVELPEPYASEVANFELLVNTSTLDPIKCGLVAYGENLVVTITSILEDTTIQRHFFRKLAEDGAEVVLESNGAFYEIL